ncbi:MULTISPECIES: GntR family transcriptional regulator [Halocynthiibacter]|uniref:GntR family transcriptional regulator n=1 Tax=Halocynthiibacter halioticoli TaxID=2986804 RepID=A0AAE3IZE4_9RHOB|nr:MULTISPECIES: GntR family transcriptional regulator [Halocynthiibacter]MCV6824829.1 GntR family transcriptional regulator [Halocynthiibacter halioticoli]MCW4057830.1 GntR family transcriptional regulator [Halocynthiibacter sp. SDUM655004]
MAYRQLRQLLLTGGLAPGEKLKIDRLRDVLDMGASPIREALSLLVSDQLVVRHEQRGFQAAEISRENFDEILNLRSTLESKALRQSMEQTTPEWVEELVLIHHRMSRMRAVGTEEFEFEHKNFHMGLIGNCNSPLMMRICNQLYDLNIRYRYIAARSDSYKGRNVDAEHQQILDSVIAENTDEAVRLLLLHYEKTGDYLKAFIK